MTIELQFHADGSLDLVDAIRQAAAREGGGWSRRKVAQWIAGGHVRADGEVVTEPRRVVPAGARVDLQVESGPRGLAAAGHAPAAAPLPILHVDRHLLVVEFTPGPGRELEEGLRACLDRLGVRDAPPRLPFLTAPPAGVTGLVAAALTAEAAEALDAAFAAGEAWMVAAGVEGRLGPRDLGRLRGEVRIEGLHLPHPRHGRPLDFLLEP